MLAPLDVFAEWQPPPASTDPRQAVAPVQVEEPLPGDTPETALPLKRRRVVRKRTEPRKKQTASNKKQSATKNTAQASTKKAKTKKKMQRQNDAPRISGMP